MNEASPYPPRKPLITCSSCGAKNEPDRTECLNPKCRAAL